MTRLYFLIGGLSLIITLAGALWWSIDRNATDRARTDGLQSTINNAGEYNEKAGTDNGGWYRSLFPDAAD